MKNEERSEKKGRQEPLSMQETCCIPCGSVACPPSSIDLLMLRRTHGRMDAWTHGRMNAGLREGTRNITNLFSI